MEIINLAYKPVYTQKVVDCLFMEWGIKDDEKNCIKNNRNYWESWVKSSINIDKIPQTFIALDGTIFVGTFSLWRCDLQSRQDIFPWFGGLYIEPEYRGRGYSKIFQAHALTTLKQLGFHEVHLFTELKGFYEKTGWKLVGDIPDEHGEIVQLFKHAIV